jgi:hypothetical protein
MQPQSHAYRVRLPPSIERAATRPTHSRGWRRQPYRESRSGYSVHLERDRARVAEAALFHRTNNRSGQPVHHTNRRHPMTATPEDCCDGTAQTGAARRARRLRSPMDRTPAQGGSNRPFQIRSEPTLPARVSAESRRGQTQPQTQAEEDGDQSCDAGTWRSSEMCRRDHRRDTPMGSESKGIISTRAVSLSRAGLTRGQLVSAATF